MGNLQDRFTAYASRPDAEMALFAAAVAETVFVPVSPDPLMVPMVLINPGRAFRYALISTAGSVAGGIVAFLIGFMLYQTLGLYLIHAYNLPTQYAFFHEIFTEANVLIVLSAGLATVPFKLVSFLSGFFVASLPPFVLASATSRAARAFLIAWLLWRGGTRYKQWIEDYFHGLSMVLALGALLLSIMLMLLIKTS